MDIVVYMQKVVELFRYGNPTDDQWREMANAVLDMAELDPGATCHIDSEVLPQDQQTVDPSDCSPVGTWEVPCRPSTNNIMDC